MQKALTRAIVVLVVLVGFGCGVTLAQRKSVDLMGEWRLLPVEGRHLSAPVPAADDTWQTYTAPGLWTDNVHDSAWLVRTVEIAPEDVGKVFQFRFLSAVFHCRVFVNGTFLGEHLGAESPFFLTAPPGVFRAGINEIALGMTNASSAMKDDQCVIRDMKITAAQGAMGPFWGKATMMHHWWPAQLGLLQEAHLLILPPVYVDDIFVKPSVQKRQLVADVEVVNGSERPQGVTLFATAYELGGEAARRLPGEKFMLGAGERKVVTVAGAWETPRLWTPDDPHLYRLKVRVEANQGRIVDEDAVRFGFREITTDGYHLLLNGKKVVMRGDSWTRYNAINTKESALATLSNFQRYHNVNALRLHWDPMEQCVLDAADEMGILLLVQSPLTAGAAGEADPSWWEETHRQWLEYVKLSRNHPSVIVWGVGNEAGGMVPWNPTPASPFLAEMIRKTKALDPTRLATEAHDYYMLETSDFCDAPHGWSFESDHLFPMCCRAWYTYFWDPTTVYRRDKPWANDEWVEGHGVYAAGTLLGDLGFVHPDKLGDVRGLYARYTQAMGTYMGMIEQRRQPYFGIIMPFGDRFGIFDTDDRPGKVHPEGYNMSFRARELAQRSAAPTILAPKEWNGGALAGAPYRREFILMNDRFRDVKGSIIYAVVDEERKRLLEEHKPFSVRAVEHQDVTLQFTMPPADKPRTWKLEVELLDEQGQRLYWDEFELGVLPAVSTAAWQALQPIVVWPEAGSFGAIAGGALPLHCSVSATLPSARETVVVVPREVTVSPQQWAQLQDHVQAGGRALILTDSGLPTTFAGTPIRHSGKATAIAHVRCAEHPIVRDLPPASLRYWVGAAGEFYSPPVEKTVPNFVVSERTLRRPYWGNYLTIVDAGLGALCKAESNPGLTQAPMFEVRAGQGRAVFCTLLLAEGVKTGEPAAPWLLYHALSYLQDDASWLGRVPKPGFAVGVDITRYQFAQTNNLEQAAALVVNAASEAGSTFLANEAATWRGFAEQGGYVLLHNLSPQQAEQVGAALGIPLAATPLEQDRAPARLDWVARDEVVRGLSHFDVNWFHTGDLTRIIARQPIIAVAVASDDPRARNLTEQGAIVVLSLGQGKVIIDQVQWDSPQFADAYIQRRAEGYITQLLANLNVAALPSSVPAEAEAPRVTPETLALFHFEEAQGGVLADAGNRGCDLHMPAGAELAPGVVGKGLRFTTEDALARPLFPDTSYGMQTPDLTIDFWIKPEVEPNPEGKGAGVIMGFTRWGVRYDMCVCLTKEGRIWFQYPGAVAGGWGFASQSSIWEKDRWTRVTVTTSQQNRRCRIYLNGQLDAESNNAGHYPHGLLLLGAYLAQPPDLSAMGGVSTTPLATIDELHLLSKEWMPEAGGQAVVD